MKSASILLTNQFLYQQVGDIGTSTFHTMYSESLQSKIRRYFKCPEDTEFVCCNCSRNLCIPCKEKHADDIDTKDHSVVVYREIFKCFFLNKRCVLDT